MSGVQCEFDSQSISFIRRLELILIICSYYYYYIIIIIIIIIIIVIIIIIIILLKKKDSIMRYTKLQKMVVTTCDVHKPP